ncbi:MAG: hypothetical protein AAFS10_04305 [Myxococcota bacterium]
MKQVHPQWWGVALGALGALVASAGCGSDSPDSAGGPSVVVFTPDAVQIPAVAGLEDIRVTALSGGTVLSEETFSYAAGGGNLSGIDYGDGIQLVVEGLDSFGDPILRGTSAPFSFSVSGNTLPDLDQDGSPDVPVFISPLDAFSPATTLRQSSGGEGLVPQPVYFQVAKRRGGHAQIKLDNGLVLVTGGAVLAADSEPLPNSPTGLGVTEVLNTVEVYDPQTGLFFERSPLLQPRAFHTMTLLNDGRVLVSGGIAIIEKQDGSREVQTLATAEVFDPSRPSDPWRSVPNGLFEGRAWHTATLRTLDGRVALIGGRQMTGDATTVLASAEFFNPETNRFELNAGAAEITMAQARAEHAAVLLQTGPGAGATVLVVGGLGDTGALRTTEALVVVGDANRVDFRSGPTLGTGRYGHAALSVTPEEGNLVLVAGGLDDARSAVAGVEVLDIAQNAFFPVDDLGTGRAYAELLEMPQTQEVLLLGGLGSDGNPVGGAERLIYDPTTMRYLRLPIESTMQLPRFWHRYLLLDNGLVLITGGVGVDASGYTSLDQAEVFNPDDGPPGGGGDFVSSPGDDDGSGLLAP